MDTNITTEMEQDGVLNAAIADQGEQGRETAAEIFSKLRVAVEGFRREKDTMDTEPVSGVHDYSFAGNMLDLGMSHLDEAIPNGQKRRVEIAFGLLHQGVVLTSRWLIKRGYNVKAL